MVDGSQEVLLEEVERLAANQHARLEELQQSSGVVEAALRSLRHGDPRLVRQVLKSQTCSDTARSGRSEPDEAVSSRGRDSRPAEARQASLSVTSLRDGFRCRGMKLLVLALALHSCEPWAAKVPTEGRPELLEVRESATGLRLRGQKLQDRADPTLATFDSELYPVAPEDQLRQGVEAAIARTPPGSSAPVYTPKEAQTPNAFPGSSEAAIRPLRGQQLECHDSPATWKDANNNSCYHYETGHWCNSQGAAGAGWKDTWGTFAEWSKAMAGNGPVTACCACGGGIKFVASVESQRPLASRRLVAPEDRLDLDSLVAPTETLPQEFLDASPVMAPMDRIPSKFAHILGAAVEQRERPDVLGLSARFFASPPGDGCSGPLPVASAIDRALDYRMGFTGGFQRYLQDRAQHATAGGFFYGKWSGTVNILQAGTYVFDLALGFDTTSSIKIDGKEFLTMGQCSSAKDEFACSMKRCVWEGSRCAAPSAVSGAAPSPAPMQAPAPAPAPSLAQRLEWPRLVPERTSNVMSPWHTASSLSFLQTPVAPSPAPAPGLAAAVAPGPAPVTASPGPAPGQLPSPAPAVATMPAPAPAPAGEAAPAPAPAFPPAFAAAEGKPGELHLTAGGHCVEVIVKADRDSRSIQLKYNGPDTGHLDTVIPGQVLFCDPVVPACVQPELDPAVVNFEDGLGPRQLQGLHAVVWRSSSTCPSTRGSAAASASVNGALHSSRLDRPKDDAGSRWASSEIARGHLTRGFGAPGWPPPPRTAWSGGSSPTDRETPPPEYAPVWGRIPGAEEMWASPKEPKGSTDADDQQSAPSCVKRGDPQDADRERRRGEIPDHFVGPGTTVMGRSSSHGNLKDPAFLGRHRRHGAGGPPRIHGFVGHEREDICPGDFGWLGAGRRHFSTKDHMLAAGMSSGQASPKGKKLMPAQDHLQSGWAVHIPPEHEVRHGRQREAAFHNGLERFIGHGRRHRPEWVQKDNPFRPIQDATPGPRRRPVGGADHIVPGCGQASCLEDASPVGRRHFGARDNIRPGFAFDKTHSEGSIGYGRQRIQEKAHLLGGLSRAADCPGQHGHARDDDFQDGIERGIGHGNHSREYQQAKLNVPAVAQCKLSDWSARDLCLLTVRSPFPLPVALMAAMALPSFASTQAQVKGKKEKSPKKVLLKTQQEAGCTIDEEHFTTIAPPPGLEKCDDDFSDSLWSRSTTGGSAGFETQPEEEVEDDFGHAALAEQIAAASEELRRTVTLWGLRFKAKLSAMQIQETMATMYFNNLSTSPPAPMQAGEPAFAAAWTPTPVRNFCPWCGCKRAACYTFCPNCGNKLDE
eukprot:s611_g8.t2